MFDAGKIRIRIGLVMVCILVGVMGASFVLIWGAGAQAAPQSPGVDLGPGQSAHGEAGQTIIYLHTLTNTGTAMDTFVIEVHSAQGWPVTLLDESHPGGAISLSLEVGAQLTAPFQVSLTVPAGAVGVSEMTIITATSQLSPIVQDTAVDTTIIYHRTLFPIVSNRWPPIPRRATLNPIFNADGDGMYSVTWPETELALTHSLEEDDHPAFSSPTEVYNGSGTTWAVPSPGKTAGTFYYRVRGHNTWGYGEYSNVEAVTVLLPDTPVLNAIDNADGDTSYSVTWSTAARAVTYILHEDTDANFGSPTTVYEGTQTGWTATGKEPGTYYYRIRASGPTGQSGWSNVRTASVGSFRADSASLIAGQCTTLRWDFDHIRAIYISFGFGYDLEGVAGHGTGEVCPSVTTTYEALVVQQDGNHVRHFVTIDVTGTGCGDPVIERFSSTAYNVAPGQPFSIFWDVECAANVHLIQGDGPEDPVVGHGSRIDVTIYTDTLFKLKVEKINGEYVYASFLVHVVTP